VVHLGALSDDPLGPGPQLEDGSDPDGTRAAGDDALARVP
jgi:hypothetical protein